MDGTDGVAERIARFRKLAGWTQYQLALRTFVSTSLVKKVEQCRAAPSPAFVACCARAFGVDAALLYGKSVAEDLPEVDRAGVNELRGALHAFDDPDVTGQWSDAELARQVRVADGLRSSFRYEELCQRMPQLLRQLFARCAEARADTQAGERVRALLHDAYRLVATLGGRFGQPDVAVMASERHMGLAASTGDPLRVAISAYHRSTYLLQRGDFKRGLVVLERAHAAVNEGTGPARHAVAIQLHLRSAVVAARSGDGARADEHIAESRFLHEKCAPPASPYHNIDASRLNIDVHWCAVPVERGDGTTSVARGGQVTIADPARPERVGHHHIDMARAWLLHGNRDNVIAELHAARRTSPRHTRDHPTVRETVRTLAESDRRATGSLAEFARWARIQL